MKIAIENLNRVKRLNSLLIKKNWLKKQVIQGTQFRSCSPI